MNVVLFLKQWHQITWIVYLFFILQAAFLLYDIKVRCGNIVMRNTTDLSICVWKTLSPGIMCSLKLVTCNSGCYV